MHLVIVESPTKAKTIRKYLGRDYTVLASMGHVRDLPQSSSDVPAELKKTTLGQLGVDPDNNFEPLYLVPKDKTKTITELKKALKDADELFLATDEDREGESISWHLMEVLKPKVPVHRMVFHEITKPAIESALAHPRKLDDNLVRAQETRRILDRLVGYTISPVLWKKIAYGLSAGRVQSATLKAIIDRERARMAFTKAGYWDVNAVLHEKDVDFEAKLSTTNGKRVASGKDFQEDTGTVKAGADVVLVDETKALAITEDAKKLPWQVVEVTEKPVQKHPAPPFITSTLQQESNRKLGLSSKETMRTAQALYEQGYITYMRTDSFNLSQEAVASARRMIAERYGKEFVHEEPRSYATTKGAQEAHEAIRPSLDFTPPDELPLSGTEKALYEMIWMRTLACQMSASQQTQTSVALKVGDHGFSASGLKIVFPGFLRAYVESSDDSEQALADMERHLPALATDDTPKCTSAEALKHETKPPTRFTEAGLIQFLEKEGIGRPSTYASIISTLTDRGYVRKTNNALVPTFTAFAVIKLMEDHFGDLVDAKFTSHMEEGLDDIAEGKQEWLPYLRDFYFGEKGLKHRVEHELDNIDPETARTVTVDSAPDIHVKIGRFGPYFEALHPKHHTLVKATVPPEAAPGDFTPEYIAELLDKAHQGPTNLGFDETSGKNILLRTGSFGPYLQLGEQEEGSKIKPKRVSVPKNIPLETLDQEKARALLSLPRTLGQHPETQKDIKAGFGRFGAYVVCDGDFRSLKAEDDVLTVTLERALELLAQPKTGRGRGAAALRTLGNHPKDDKPITLHQGKFGLYVKHVRKNASLPKDTDPATVTLEQAVELLAQRKTRTKRTSAS
ncbi:MAG: type I DNA topoisomerase [Patescibacteria group bacterium]